MKISFVQSGGFAGIIRGCDLDTEQLDKKEAKKLLDMVQSSGVRTVGLKRSKPRPDVIQYRLTFLDESGEQEIVFDDMSVSDQVYPLVEYLQRLSKPRKPS